MEEEGIRRQGRWNEYRMLLWGRDCEDQDLKTGNHSQRLGVWLAELLGGVLLVFAQKLWSENDVSGLVDTVDVTESGGDGEVGGDGGEGRVDIVNVGWLGVEGCVVGVRVVDTILLTTGDTNLHLEPFYIRSQQNSWYAYPCERVTYGPSWPFE